MLISTKIILQYSDKIALGRDWRVVSLPDADSKAIDILTLFVRISNKVYDALDPFILSPTQRGAPIRAEIGRTQKGDFQDVSLSICVADVVDMFGLYVKFYILLEDLDVPTITLERNAYDVRLSSHFMHAFYILS